MEYKRSRDMVVTTYELCPKCGTLKQGVEERTRYGWWSMSEEYRRLFSCLDCFEHDKDTFIHYSGEGSFDFDEGY